MLKVLFILFFYFHLNYGAPESYTFNFTDMPSSINLNFNVKPGKTVGPIKPVISVDPVKPEDSVKTEDPVKPEPRTGDCKCGIIPEENGLYPGSNRAGDLFLIFYEKLKPRPFRYVSSGFLAYFCTVYISSLKQFFFIVFRPDCFA